MGLPSFAIGFLTIKVLTSELGEYQDFRFGNVKFRMTARTAVEWTAEHKSLVCRREAWIQDTNLGVISM